MVAIKLIGDIENSSYSVRKVLREIIILRKLSEIEGNIFTVKLLDVIIPKCKGTDIEEQKNEIA
mgnify:CR=1 FL=1